MTDHPRYIGPAARFFEDFTLGERIVSQGRTVTPADGLFWSMFTGDMNPMHVDYDYASKHGLFGGAFPAGLTTIAIASGLMERLGLSAGTGLAIIEQTIRYKSVVLFGETIRIELHVAALKSHATKPQGKVSFDYKVVKSDGEVAIEGEWIWLFAGRGSIAAPAP